MSPVLCNMVASSLMDFNPLGVYYQDLVSAGLKTSYSKMVLIQSPKSYLAMSILSQILHLLLCFHVISFNNVALAPYINL